MKAADARYHQVSWTPQAVRRFWDFQGENAASEHGFFSRRFARRIVGLAERRGALAGPVIDVGCGPGFLCEELLGRGHAAGGVDASSRNVARARARLAGRPGFLGVVVGEGASLPLADARAGALFLVEVLEHLSPAARAALLDEIARVLRPGGTLVATTPNQEDLDAKKVACPECGCVFHRVQHLASLDAALLGSLLDAHGFEAVFLEAVNFRHFPDLALGRAVAGLAARFPALGDPARPPHLVAIARRRRRAR